MPVRIERRAAVTKPPVLKSNRSHHQSGDFYVDTYGDMYTGGTPPTRLRGKANGPIVLKAMKG